MTRSKLNSLTSKTAEGIRRRIVEGPIRAGEKLSTEKALAVEFGVSRTVIREAIATLRADGILEARHGVGVFVTQAPSNDLAPTITEQAASVLDILELRMAVEVHAAGLAAARRSWAQEARIWSAFENFKVAVESNQPTEPADLDFHRSIAEATNNPSFPAFLDSLGGKALPRNAIQAGAAPLITPTYMHKSVVEHKAVCDAISAGDISAARQAMRQHLGSSQQRYSALASGRTPVEVQQMLDRSSD